MDILEFLSEFKRSDYQRDNFDAFLDKIKFHYDVPSIHIAGTNGKGSVAHYLNEILIENGYKTGIFSTPDDFFETIKINNEPVKNEYLEKTVKEYTKLFKKYNLSEFEIHTFLALNYFKENAVDIAIVECGMGGELDATNIFTPVLSIITSISIEHSAFLGDSLSEIAAHKAGIIKQGIPVLVGKVEGDALEVVVNKTKYEGSKLTIVDQFHNFKVTENGASFDYRPYYNLSILNPAEFSVFAASLAVEATNLLKDEFPIEESKLKSGLSKMKLKCRFDKVSVNPLVIIDGAHNPEAITQLRQEIDKCYPGKIFNIVFASFRDKSIANMLPEINLVGKVHLTTFNHYRARQKDDYFIYLEDYEYFDDYKELIRTLLNDDKPILIAGSLAFGYEARKFFEELKNEKL